MIRKYNKSELSNDDQNKLTAVICALADLFTAPDVVSKQEFARISQDVDCLLG